MVQLNVKLTDKPKFSGMKSSIASYAIIRA